MTEDTWLALAVGRSRSLPNGKTRPESPPVSWLARTETGTRFLVLVDWPAGRGTGPYVFGAVVGYAVAGFSDCAAAEMFCKDIPLDIGRLRVVDLHSWNGKRIKLVCERLPAS